MHYVKKYWHIYIGAQGGEVTVKSRYIFPDVISNVR